MLYLMLILCSLSVLSYSALANITEAVIVVYTVESDTATPARQVRLAPNNVMFVLPEKEQKLCIGIAHRVVVKHLCIYSLQKFS